MRDKKELLKIEELEKIGRMFLEAVDVDPDRPGLIETPKRFAKYWSELLEGQKYTNQEIADMFDKCFDYECDDTSYSSSNIRGLVVETDIPLFSTCEHHVALMYNMYATIAYIPKDRVIGLSKMGRIVEMVGKRLQLQEKICDDIKDVMSKVLGTEDVFVAITGKHACMTARGIKARESVTNSTSLGGAFQTNPLLEEKVYNLQRLKSRGE